MVELRVARSELILGGQKSGKSRRAEALAAQWLAADPDHRAVLIATGTPGDAEMRERIARHRRERLPGLDVVEVPCELGQALRQHGNARTLLLVDCLTLWLTQLTMPLEPAQATDPWPAADDLLAALAQAPGPVVLVGNEIGLGVIPLGAQVRAFVDALGTLNQAVAGVCQRVTLMAAGLPLTLKEVA